MEYRQLGRTDLRVSLVGLGSGGPSNLGQTRGTTPAEARALVRRALDHGINFIDTARGYGDSEVLLGHALEGVPRDAYVLATKYAYCDGDRGMRPAAEVATSIDESLERLGLEFVDVMQVHALRSEHYDEVIERHLPVLLKAQAAGKTRFIGVTETFGGDGPHAMLRRALPDGHFDTAMVGYNLLHQGAEGHVFSAAAAADVGVIIMVAVRRALGNPVRLRELLAELKAGGDIESDGLPDDDPLGWLVHDEVDSVPAAAYKFVAEPSAVSTVLTGTADPAHLDANVKALLGDPLPAEDRERLQALFGHLERSLGN